MKQLIGLMLPLTLYWHLNRKKMKTEKKDGGNWSGKPRKNKKEDKEDGGKVFLHTSWLTLKRMSNICLCRVYLFLKKEEVRGGWEKVKG
jgi:hypothetical protein